MNAALQNEVPRRGWRAGFSFTAYGVGIEVRSNDAAILQEARRCVPPGAELDDRATPRATYLLLRERESGSTADPAHYALSCGGLEVTRASSLDAVLDRMESDIRITVADHARERVFVHAGVVGWRGRAIVVPGVSFSGKSTLVAELVRAGAEYYSDEYAVCGLDGLVHPYPKALELRDEGARSQRKLALREIQGVVGTVPLRTGLVLVTRFKSHAVWDPRTLTPGAGLLELLKNTVSARRSPENAFTALSAIVQSATVLEGERGDAREIAEAVLALSSAA